jgi:tripartite ATP-independent transporter DctP family solute receptor
MFRKAVLMAFTVGALIHGGTALARTAYKPEYRLSTVVGTTFPWGQAGERWAALVRNKTQGRINIKQYPGVSLVGGEQTREFTAIRQGVIDLAIGSTINWSPQVKELNVFALPFLMPDKKAIDALVRGEVGKKIFGILEKRNVVPLAWGENGFREISNSRRAISSPDDIKGLKIRVVGSPMFNDIFTALGADPIQMNWTDAQSAFASSAVDGQENPLAVFFFAKLPIIGQKYLTLWHYIADPLIFAVNKDVWEQWTPDDRELVREAALQAARENVENVRQSDASMLRQIESTGTVVTALTDAQRKSFIEATRDVHEKWSKIIGVDLIEKAESDIEKR